MQLAEEQRRKAVEERQLADMEKQRQEEERLSNEAKAREEAEAKARAEAEQAKQLLRESSVGSWTMNARCSWGSGTYTFVITNIGANGDLSFSSDSGNIKIKEGHIENDSISFFTSNLLNTVNYTGKIISQTHMEGTLTQTLSSETCNWVANK